MSALFQFVSRNIVRPYTVRELPGWGRLLHLVNANGGRRWRDTPSLVIRGKVHGYKMHLDPRGWSNRLTWFLGRYYDLGTQLVVGGLLERGDTFVDIGGNEGMISLVAAQAVGPQGKVIAFEPNPTPRGVFEKNLASNGITNVELIAAGASNEPGELTLYIAGINSGEGSFAKGAIAERDGLDKVVCPIVVPDAVLEGVTPKVIKIDVEGFEGLVIAGLEKTLARAKPILIMEMVATHLGNAGFTIAQICETLTGHGYRGYRIQLEGGASGSLSLIPLNETAWEEEVDVIWVPADGAEAVVAPLQGFGLRQLHGKFRRV